MPLVEYVAEAMRILGGPTPPRGEILVGQVKAFRWAERNGEHDRKFTALDPR